MVISQSYYTNVENVEENPGPQYNSCQGIFVLYWNLISICGHNFIKSSLHACITTNQCDILCLSEIFWIVVFYGYYRRTLDIHFFHFSHVKRGNGHNLCNFISLYRSNFRGKAELFSNFLAQQCTLMDNASEIPSTLNIKTAKTLSSIPVTRADIAKIIKKQCKWFLFKSCFESNMFLSEWRKQM